MWTVACPEGEFQHEGNHTHKTIDEVWEGEGEGEQEREGE